MKALLRPGLALYGLVPQFDPNFAPEQERHRRWPPARRAPACAHMEALVVGVRSVPAGATVGYNGTFVATEPMRLALSLPATVTASTESLATASACWCAVQRAPLVGRVSMDQSVLLDVTEIPGVQAGDEVVILGDARKRRPSPHSITPMLPGPFPGRSSPASAPRVARVAV
jgi:alanine racemase